MLCHPLQLKSFRCSLFRPKNRSEMQNFWNLSNFISHLYITSKLNGSLNGSATYSKFKPAKIVKIGNVHEVFKKMNSEFIPILGEHSSMWHQMKTRSFCILSLTRRADKIFRLFVVSNWSVLILHENAKKQTTHMIWFK